MAKLRPDNQTEREIIVDYINRQAHQARQNLQAAMGSVSNATLEVNILLGVADNLGVTEDEMGGDLRNLMEKRAGPSESSQDLNLDTARQVCGHCYTIGKFEGREAVGVFRNLFGQIDNQLLARFDAIE